MAMTKAGQVTTNAPARERKPRVVFSEALLTTIFDRVAAGESLSSVCSGDAMPTRKAFFDWVAADPTIQARYEVALGMRAEVFAEEILAIADEEVTMVKRSKHQPGAEDDDIEVEVVFDPTAVARNKLRVDARKWLASKMAPKKYGDKVETTLAGSLRVVSATELKDDELAAIASGGGG